MDKFLCFKGDTMLQPYFTQKKDTTVPIETSEMAYF